MNDNNHIQKKPCEVLAKVSFVSVDIKLRPIAIFNILLVRSECVCARVCLNEIESKRRRSIMQTKTIFFVVVLADFHYELYQIVCV